MKDIGYFAPSLEIGSIEQARLSVMRRLQAERPINRDITT
jgi:hypothetical protein